MKTTEEYLEDYFAKQNELSSKGELWRLRVTQEKFLSEIQRLREYEIDLKNSELNENHIQRNIEATIAVMLMDAYTFEEKKEQVKRLNEESEKEFAKEAPLVRERLKSIKTPLSFRDSGNIYRWIFRKQISIDMLPENISDEFKKTVHYVSLKIEKKI
jgi:small-conductance mechanosensitive channel